MTNQSDFIFENVFEDGNITAALESFKNKPSSCGIDGISIAELPEYFELNKETIIDSILRGRYLPGIVQNKSILGKNGKERYISIINSVDRLILKCMSQILSLYVDNSFSEHSFAYRTGRGTTAAVKLATDYIQSGYRYVAEIDLEKFFDNINLEKLVIELKEIIKDDILLNLIYRYLYCKVEDNGIISSKNIGLIQGSPLSPVLSNIYLDKFDKYLESKDLNFCRFCDDINIYCKDYDSARVIFQEVRVFLKDSVSLNINEHKSGIYEALNRIYLGYTFESKKGEIYAKKFSRRTNTIYNNWYTTSIQKIDANYHLINNGILTKKDYTILFENENKKVYIPIETMDTLYVHSNIIFSSDFFQMVNQKGLNVVMFDKYGNKIGGFVPYNSKVKVKLQLEQIRLYLDEGRRFELAKKLEIASISNLRANIRYYIPRKSNSRLDEIAAALSGYIAELNEKHSINDMMMTEAKARQIYYESFDIIMSGSEFHFCKRTRMPPKNPLNAMISFGNTLLYQRIASALNRSGLDIRFGIVHAANNRPESLNLDLADIFKPILVDRTIFTLVNKKMIDINRDFYETNSGGIYLSKSGKIVFIKEFEKKIYQKLNINNTMRTYDFLINHEINLLKNHILKNEKYKPYKYTS